MRALPEGLSAALAAGGAGLATVWLVTRADGVRLGFTDHDADLRVDGVLCAAATGWTAGAAHAEQGSSPGLATATGALDSAAITEADIAAGLYDGAAVEFRRVLWSDPAEGVLLWRGVIARLARDGSAFTAEIEGPIQALERVVGRSYGRACDARLGDARCRAVVTPEQRAAGCDKRFSTCVGTFDNAVNFQGFPDIPGDDYLAVVATTAALNDGGSRR